MFSLLYYSRKVHADEGCYISILLTFTQILILTAQGELEGGIDTDPFMYV